MYIYIHTPCCSYELTIVLAARVDAPPNTCMPGDCAPQTPCAPPVPTPAHPPGNKRNKGFARLMHQALIGSRINRGPINRMLTFRDLPSTP